MYRENENGVWLCGRRSVGRARSASQGKVLRPRCPTNIKPQVKDEKRREEKQNEMKKEHEKKEAATSATEKAWRQGRTGGDR